MLHVWQETVWMARVVVLARLVKGLDVATPLCVLQRRT